MEMDLGLDLLPLWVSVIWIVALAIALVFHCGHLIHMGGQHRGFHSAHVVMLLGMLYMYAAMTFGWDWFPRQVWMWIYVTTSAAIILWMLVRFWQRRPFSYLWILVLVQQAAMVYMWVPMIDWISWLTYALVAYFALETIAWLTGLCNDVRYDHRLAVGPGDSLLVVPLGYRSAFGNISMVAMGASMGYMFAVMQLMG